ncbi:hypothetical protein [Streptomyces sp. NPDC056401]|uniref:hypothetical protein n=1 Tax=Streptomyces sp. NPDC056401 TaxID=3345809 RepID=UPI0035DBAA3C
MEHDQTIPEQRKEEDSTPEQGIADATRTTPEAPPEATLDAAPEAAPAAPRRRGGRTVLLIAGAAALGVLAGTITGYAIQYDREPTPLAPLAQAMGEAPKPVAPNDSTTLRSINANRWVKTDDDLTKLLMDAPEGAKLDVSGAESPDEFAADYYEQPNRGLGSQIGRDVRRIAGRTWVEDDREFFVVRLFQYRDRMGADGYQNDHYFLSDDDYAGNVGKNIPGIPAPFGHLWIDSKTREKPGYYPTRSARVIARRGDIVLEIEYVNNRGTVDEGHLVDVTKRQWERL